MAYGVWRMAYGIPYDQWQAYGLCHGLCRMACHVAWLMAYKTVPVMPYHIIYHVGHSTVFRAHRQALMY